MLSIAALMLAQAAPVPSSSASADARCIAVFSYVAANDRTHAALAHAGVLYFAGKLYGRNPHTDLTAVLRSAGEAISANPKADLARCSDEAEAAVHALARAGRTIGSSK